MADAAAPSTPPGKPGLSVSPLAVPFPEMGEIEGVEIATARAGFYKHEREDLALFRFAPGTACAGVFTQSSVGSGSPGHRLRRTPGGLFAPPPAQGSSRN